MKKFGRKSEDDKKKGSVITKETLGVVLILFSTLCLICLIAGGSIFSTPGAWVSAFLLGCFGYFAYALCLFGIFMGILLVSGKRTGLSIKRKVIISFIVVFLALLVHTITMHAFIDLSYGDYLAKSYDMGKGGLVTSSGGGVVTGVVAFCISKLLTPIGGYIVTGVLLALLVYTLVADIVKASKKAAKADEHRSSYVKVPEENLVTDYTVSGVRDYPVDTADLGGTQMNGMQKLFISNPDDFTLKNKKELRTPTADDIKISSVGGMSIGVKPIAPVNPKAQHKAVKHTQPAPNMPDNLNYQEKLAYIRTPAEIKIEGYEDKADIVDVQETSVSAPIAKESVVIPVEENIIADIPYFEHDESETISPDSASAHADNFNSRYASVQEFDEPIQRVEPRDALRSIDVDLDGKNDLNVDEPKEEVSAKEILGLLNTEETLINKEVKEEETPSEVVPRIRERRTRTPIVPIEPIQEKPTESVPEQTVMEEVQEDTFRFKKYVRPPLDLLANYEPPADAPKEDHETKMAIIEDTLHQFKLDAKVAGYVQGPTLTRYELTMPAGRSVKEVGKYDDDLKMRLKVEGGVRIEAPIPGLDRVGVEVANRVTQKVGLRKTLEGMSAKPMKDGELRFAIGQDLLGNAIFDNLATGPHYLVAGSTGSGKSVCLHIMIISLIMTYGPEDLRLILVNPKVVEFGIYRGLPHLLIDEVINNSTKTSAALAWAYEEMLRRGKLFMEHADVVVDIDGYNKYIANDKIPKLPRIVIIIDEYADLISDGKEKDLSTKVAALAQMSRSAGIHLVLATQRPTTNIVTGTIKTNLPSRIALKLTNAIDSNTIIDEAGAEKLIGYGDMLYRNAGMANCKRYQGAFIDRMEMKSIVDFIKQNNETHFNQDLTDRVRLATQVKEDSTAVQGTSSGAEENTERNLENDPMFLKCLAFGVRQGSISINTLQRHFPVGYNKAAKIFDKIESLGYISENIGGGKPRTVLLTKEGFEATYGPLDSYGV